MSTEQITRAINQRGFYLDKFHALEQILRVESAKAAMLKEMRKLTGLRNPNAPIPLREWLNGNGCNLPDLQAATVRDALLTTVDIKVARVLQLRQYVSKTPTSKYQAALNRVSSDGRMRNTLMYCGATRTGRWSSTGVNWQNLPRPIREENMKPEGTPERAIQEAANGIRGLIIASSGKRLVVSDLKSIEARVLAWLADERWALDAFANGEDIYRMTYAGMTGKALGAVTGAERFIGKVASLALGYQGGLGAFTEMAAGYDLDLSQLYDVVWSVAPQHHDSAQWMLKYHREHGTDRGLEDRVILACEVIKLGWRATNGNIVKFWGDLEQAWRDAMDNPGEVVPAGKVVMQYGTVGTGPVLRMTLPSGRQVYHHKPAISVKDGGLRYMSQNSMTRQWEWTATYGGSISETCAQAIARDVLAVNLPLAEMLGYEVVGLVHDEVISESVDGTAEELNAVLSVVPRWARGLPLDADGYEAMRYKK